MAHKDLVHDIILNFGSPMFNCEFGGFRVGWNRNLLVPPNDIFERRRYGNDIAEALGILQKIKVICTAQNILVEGELEHIETRRVELVLDPATRKTICEETAPWRSGLRKDGQPLFQIKIDLQGVLRFATLASLPKTLL